MGLLLIAQGLPIEWIHERVGRMLRGQVGESGRIMVSVRGAELLQGNRGYAKTKVSQAFRFLGGCADPAGHKETVHSHSTALCFGGATTNESVRFEPCRVGITASGHEC